MSLHEFTVHLDRAPSDDDLDALFEAGLDDTLPEIIGGRGLLHVTREADTLAGAILSTVDDVTHAGFKVIGIEDEDLVSLKTIAARLGRSPESVRLLAAGKRGPGNFPPAMSGDGWSLYSWAAVAVWASKYLGSTDTVSEHARIITAANHLLQARAVGVDLSQLSALTH